MIYEHLLKLPSRIRGFVREDIEGNKHIYYNEADIRQETYAHEMEHIRNDDLHREDVEELR